jgi:N-hydroxyarylamine O-acetyltransferase
MNVSAYLSRIGYAGPVSPTADTLRALHRAHMMTVPFENLDILCGRQIVLDTDLLVRKVVELRRGGFCYELNGAFASLLTALGFRVTLLSARVSREDGSTSPEFDHLTLRVELEEPWLADVGFGDSFIDPLRLRVGLEQKQGERVFRIVEQGDGLKVERREQEGGWKPEYQFTLQPRALEEFAYMCHYHQTSPESWFTRKRLCTLATEQGRLTLSEMKLVKTRSREKEERVLASEEEWRAVLAEEFGLVVP